MLGVTKKFFSRKAERDAEPGPASRQQTSLQEGPRDDDIPEHHKSSENNGRSGNNQHMWKIAKLEAQIQDMSAEKKQRDETISNFITELHRQQEIAQQHAKNIEQQDEVINDLREGLSIVQEQNKRLEAAAMERQQGGALQPLVPNKWHIPKEDRYVRDELSKLGDRIRNWARSNSVSLFSDLDAVATGDKDLVLQALSGYCAHRDWGTMVNRFPVPRDRMPALLVQATLAKDLFGNLFTDPFFALGGIKGDKAVPGPEEMRTLLDGIARVSESAAHIWRSQTIHGLSNAIDPKTQPLFMARLDPICRRFVTNFLQGPVHVLLRKDGDPARTDQKRFQELYGLYTGAAQLALTLWGQRASMTCRTLQGLPPFAIGNEEMIVHRLHHLDEDDTRLDGVGVLLLLQPAILAFGSENAEHYDQHKVWAPAIVLLHTKEHEG